MKQFLVTRKNAISSTLGILLMGVITLSFQDTPFANDRFSGREAYESACTDTIPVKEGISMKEFDKLQAELDKTFEKVTAEFKNKDFSKMQLDATEAAIKDIDLEKIMENAGRSLQNIDLEKMMDAVSNSLKDVSAEFKSEEMSKAMVEAKEAIEKARIELKETDKEALKKELALAKEEIKKSKSDFEKIDMHKIMEEAKSGINKAKEELKLTKEMFTEMEKDGLVDAKAGFTIEYKNKELYINDKKQDEQITNKYREYFLHDHFKIRIEKE